MLGLRPLRAGKLPDYRAGDSTQKKSHRSCWNWYRTMGYSSDWAVFGTVGGHIVVDYSSLVRTIRGSGTHS